MELGKMKKYWYLFLLGGIVLAFFPYLVAMLNMGYFGKVYIDGIYRDTFLFILMVFSCFSYIVLFRLIYKSNIKRRVLLIVIDSVMAGLTISICACVAYYFKDESNIILKFIMYYLSYIGVIGLLILPTSIYLFFINNKEEE